MKKIFTFIILLFFFSIINAQWAPYCQSQSTWTAANDKDENIGKVTLLTIDNTTACGSVVGSQGTASASVVSAAGYVNYSNFVNSTVPIPVLTFGSTNSITVNITQCNGGNWTNSGKIFIDWNRDNDFLDPGEEFILHSSVAGAHTKTINITVPNNAVVGLSRMRVSVFETAIGNINSCSNLTWGEVEDYSVFIGEKVFDLSLDPIIEPDTVAFCGDSKKSVTVKVNNIGNQAMLGGFVKMNILRNGVLIDSVRKNLTNTILNGASSTINIGDLSFTTDEPLEFHAIVYHPDDQNRGNDTLKKTIWVYQHPTFRKSYKKVCLGDSTLLVVDSFSKPPHRILWENQDENDSTKILFGSNSNVQVTITRGKCEKTSNYNVELHPLPTLIMPRDTTLCNGQSIQLNVITNANTVIWSPDNSAGTSKTVGDSTKTYTATAINTTNNCIKKGDVNIRGVQLPSYSAIKDTVCINDTAIIGQTHANGFSYQWLYDSTKTTPVVNILGNNINQTGIYKYYLGYQGCRKIDSTYLKVNALPNVRAVQNRPNGICKYESDTLVATGALTYNWGSIGTGQLKVVSPLTTTNYKVTGTDGNKCMNTFTIPVIVNPQPNIIIYSNKFKDVVCIGDSAILFANGAKSYKWDDNNTDSVRNIVTSISKQFQIIGTSDKNCKDTAQFRLEVKPNFDISTTNDTVCFGETGTLGVIAPAGTSIDWGTLGTSNQVNAVGIKTVKYAVKVTSLEKCQKTEYAELVVKPKPIGNVNDAIICDGEKAQLTATGGVSYLWTQGAASSSSTINVFPKVSTDYTVEVSNEFGCKDTLNTTVKVIEKSNLQFKSLAPSYNCPTIPVTLVATPVGGKFFGTGVTGNKFSVEQLSSGIYTIQYIYIEPINNCKDTLSLNVNVIKCVSSILEKNGLQQIEIYPNPFTRNFFIKLESQVSKIATFRLFDINGKLINEKSEKLGTGSNTIEWNQENIAKGIYFIEVQIDSYTDKFKIIKE